MGYAGQTSSIHRGPIRYIQELKDLLLTSHCVLLELKDLRLMTQSELVRTVLVTQAGSTSHCFSEVLREEKLNERKKIWYPLQYLMNQHFLKLRSAMESFHHA